MKGASYPAAACLLSGLLLLTGGCRKEEPAPQSTVIFSLSETNTRTTTTDGDGAVGTWALLLYRDGKLSGSGTSASNAPIVMEKLDAGSWTAYAVVNPPASFRPETFLDQADLEAMEADLRDNAPGRLLMAGSLNFPIPVPGDGTQTIGVDRLVCRAGVQKITTAFTDPVLASLPFTLKSLFLTNCYGKAILGRDMDESLLSAGSVYWYNRMGFSSDPGVDALLSDRDIDTVISPSSPYRQAHWFYCYPNPVVTDSRGGEWSVRRTRLVLEAEIGGHTCYYSVTLPPMERNRTYLIEEAIIRTMGSGDPEEDIPGAIDIAFRTETGSWSPEYTVQENS